MSTKIVYSLVSRDSSIFDKAAGDDSDTASVGSSENNDKRGLMLARRIRILWLSNSMTLLLCLALLSYTIALSQQTTRSCVKRLSAYC